jgi:archaemetzincin
MNPEKLSLVPIGPVPDDLLNWLDDRLDDVLNVDTVVEEQIPLPEEGYNPGRNQYVGGAMFKALMRRSDPQADRTLGLTPKDCYASGLNFIFGQANMRTGLAFVALPRLRPSFYGLPPDRELFRERVLKECVHELGHTLGLTHCQNPRCVMHFSNRLQDTDVKDVDFCLRCRALLA